MGVMTFSLEKSPTPSHLFHGRPPPPPPSNMDTADVDFDAPSGENLELSKALCFKPKWSRSVTDLLAAIAFRQKFCLELDKYRPVFLSVQAC